jgi:hypothetical protein
MNIDRRREDEKAGAVDYLIGFTPGTGMNDPAIPYRDISPAPAGNLNICQHEGGTAFHADKICTGPYSHAVFCEKSDAIRSANTMFFLVCPGIV